MHDCKSDAKAIKHYLNRLVQTGPVRFVRPQATTFTTIMCPNCFFRELFIMKSQVLLKKKIAQNHVFKKFSRGNISLDFLFSENNSTIFSIVLFN